VPSAAWRAARRAALKSGRAARPTWKRREKVTVSELTLVGLRFPLHVAIDGRSQDVIDGTHGHGSCGVVGLAWKARGWHTLRTHAHPARPYPPLRRHAAHIVPAR
jgi:hypothetical protein